MSEIPFAYVLYTLKPEPLDETFFRVIHAKYAATALSSVGSYRFGGRYNPARAFEALYLTDNPVTALEEVDALLRTTSDLNGVKGPPRILLSVDCILQRVLRFNSQTLEELELTLTDITGPWRDDLRHEGTPLTHSLGRLSFERGDVEALLAPSAKNPESLNLVIFPDRLREGSQLRVFDDSGIIDARLP